MLGSSLIYWGREAAAQDKGGKFICQKIPGKGQVQNKIIITIINWLKANEDFFFPKTSNKCCSGMDFF